MALAVLFLNILELRIAVLFLNILEFLSHGNPLNNTSVLIFIRHVYMQILSIRPQPARGIPLNNTTNYIWIKLHTSLVASFSSVLFSVSLFFLLLSILSSFCCCFVETLLIQTQPRSGNFLNSASISSWKRCQFSRNLHMETLSIQLQRNGRSKFHPPRLHANPSNKRATCTWNPSQ